MKKGFFEIEEIQYKKTKKDILSCESCGAYKNCISPKMQPTGKNKKNILILGERPGGSEDKRNTQFIGDAGQVLRNKLKKLGYFLDRDFVKDNAVICWAYDEKNRKNKTPTNKEINCCRKHVFETIEKYNPKIIIPMGKIALLSLIGHRIKGYLSDVKYSDWVGEIIPDQEMKKFICPVYHPSYIMRNERDMVLDRNWENDLKKAIEIDSIPYIHNYEKDVLIIKDVNEAIESINNFIDKNPYKRIFAFDYETTGKKPHRKGHKIVTVSFSDGLFGYAFPFFDNDRFKLTWKKLLTDKNSYCIAQNASYEEMWTETILGYKIKNWYWDTMIAQSMINNRKNTKLKFYVYTKFGVLAYDSKIEKYIKEYKQGENKKSANSFNKIEEADIDDVLLYNGLDSLFTYKLYEDQINKIDNFLQNGFDLFMEGFQRLLNAQQNGVRINENILLRNERKLKRKINNLEEKIYSYKELKKWDKDKKFDFNSTNDLKHFLYNCLKCKVQKKTKKSRNPSLDHSALEKIDLPIVKDVLEWRRWEKVLNTYISQYKREIVNGFIHAFFGLGAKVKSYRSCIAKGTKILAVRDFIKHPDGIPIEKIKKGDNIYCYDDKLNLCIRKVLWAGKTGRKEIIRIHYKGAKGRYGYLDVTPEHRIRLIDGRYVQAKDLKKDYRGKLNRKNKHTPKCRVLSCRRCDDKLFVTNRKEKIEHRMIFEYFTNTKLKSKEIIHHKDGNHLNHNFSNLEKMSNKKHVSLHCKETIRSKKGIENNIIAIKKAHKEGRYKYSKGENHYFYLGLSKWECLRLIFRAKGRLTYINYDFNTLKKYCKKYKIDLNRIRLHYNNENVFLHKNKILKYLEKYGYDKTYKKLKIGYYKLRRLLEYWNISYEKGIKNQFGKYKEKKININNHIIIDIEYLNKKEDVYNLEIEDYNNFIANELCVHNSSYEPNLQNCPKRDPQAKNIIRSLIIPRKGNKLIEYDFKGMEVSGAASNNKDPVLIKYLKDDTSDMHRDWAAKLFMKDKDEIDKKKERFVAKNQFVFAEFYGSYYVDTAKGLWENMHESTKEHLRGKGIIEYADFEEHVRQVEIELWETFHVYAEWKRKIIKDYEKKGYIELLTGFRCYGPMKRNEVINYIIQGCSFHILLYTFNNVMRIMEKRKYNKSFLIGQIHDSILGNINPDDEKEIDYLVWKWGTQKVREHWPWIIVPLKIEKESSEINGNWANMKSNGFLKEE